MTSSSKRKRLSDFRKPIRKKHSGQIPKGGLKKIRPDGVCDGPGCRDTVPGGEIALHAKHYFCSALCSGRYWAAHNNTLRGNCAYCGSEVRGRRRKKGRRGRPAKNMYCSGEHMRLWKMQRSFGQDNPFRPVVEEYINNNTYYRKSTIAGARASLAHFFKYAYQEEGLTTLDQIRPGVVSRFIVHERKRGLTGASFIGHISTFFSWLQQEERVDMGNPVLPRFHSQRGAPAEARPYQDKDLEFIWNFVEASDDFSLKLAFSIGKECGLRIGEVANLRLSDVDREKQEIFVRLPTKNMRTRTVPFHDQVAKYLDEWLRLRNPDCTHDHLLHSTQLAAYNTGTIGARFKNLLGDRPSPASNFQFHRLRHTWATRLMNGGMELAVLKVLGGWESWNSMQKYIKVLDSTVKRQYEESYHRMQEKQIDDEEEMSSLFDFAVKTNGGPVTTADSVC